MSGECMCLGRLVPQVKLLGTPVVCLGVCFWGTYGSLNLASAYAAIYLSAQQASQSQKEPVPRRTCSHPCVPGLRAGTVIAHQPVSVLRQPTSPPSCFPTSLYPAESPANNRMGLISWLVPPPLGGWSRQRGNGNPSMKGVKLGVKEGTGKGFCLEGEQVGSGMAQPGFLLGRAEPEPLIKVIEGIRRLRV